MKYSDITITISYKYEGKFGTEEKTVDTIDGKELQEDAHFEGETWDIDGEDFKEKVEQFFDCQWLKDKLTEEI